MKEGRTIPLLEHQSDDFEGNPDNNSFKKIWVESKKLWVIIGPGIFSLIASFSMFVITQASAGHLGDLELAAMALAGNLIIGFDFNFMLGMASALETLCDQAFGAKNYAVLGVYLQRSWIVLFGCSLLMMPLFIFATPILKLLGQSPEIAELAGVAALTFIPLHFSFAFQFPLQRFLQSQLKNNVIAWVNLVALIVHVFVTWLVVFKLQLRLIGSGLTLSFSWWVVVVGLLGYTVSGTCIDTWTGFSMEAFSGLWEFLKLSISSGVMICMNINGWENMIPIGFFIGIGMRVANELGAGNGKEAKFATIVAVSQSIVIGFFFWILLMVFHNEIALLFTNSKVVLEAVNKLSVLLAFTVLLNSVQPILSGVAVGSGWQKYVAYINLGCYYLLGVPIGILAGYAFNLGVMGIWGGMIFGGTAIQTVILAIITIRCDWDKEAIKAKAHVEQWADLGK